MIAEIASVVAGPGPSGTPDTIPSCTFPELIEEHGIDAEKARGDIRTAYPHNVDPGKAELGRRVGRFACVYGRCGGVSA